MVSILSVLYFNITYKLCFILSQREVRAQRTLIGKAVE